MQITTSLNKNSTQTHINQTKNLFCSGKELSVSWASKFQVLFIVRASLSRALNKIVLQGQIQGRDLVLGFGSVLGSKIAVFLLFHLFQTDNLSCK